MADSDPKSLNELNIKTRNNMKVTGYGIEGVTHHMPCFFCAEPNFMVYRIVDSEEVMQQNHTCSKCGRSSRTIITKNLSGTKAEIVQTGGEDPPDWFPFKVRRVDE